MFASIQITKWATEEIIAIRNSSKFPIFDIAMNPFDNMEFATAGYNNVSIWEINDRNLLRKTVLNITETENPDIPCIQTSIAYVCYNVNKLFNCTKKINLI